METIWWMSWTIRCDYTSRAPHAIYTSITPTEWPPPACVLGYWFINSVKDGIKIRALCRGEEAAIKAQIEAAWPAFIEWTLTKRRESSTPVESPYAPSAWAVALGRWPWRVEADDLDPVD